MPMRETWDTKNGVLIKLLKKENYHDALGLVERAFYVDESMCRAVKLVENMQGQKELNQLCVQAFQDGVSLLAIEKSTGKIAGAAFNKIQTKSKPGETFFEVFKEKECRDEASKSVVDFMIKVDAITDIYGQYGVDKTLEVMFLMVDRDFRRMGIGKMLVETAFDLACELGIEIVNAMFTSEISQRIGRDLAMDELAEASHDEFIFDGVPFTQRTVPNKSTVLMAKKVA